MLFALKHSLSNIILIANNRETSIIRVSLLFAHDTKQKSKSSEKQLRRFFFSIF